MDIGSEPQSGAEDVSWKSSNGSCFLNDFSFSLHSISQHLRDLLKTAIYYSGKRVPGKGARKTTGRTTVALVRDGEAWPLCEPMRVGGSLCLTVSLREWMWEETVKMVQTTLYFQLYTEQSLVPTLCPAWNNCNQRKS